MRWFLSQLWRFVHPYRGRLVLGAVCGIIYALGSGLLLLAVKLVFDAIFPTESVRELDSIARLPAFLSEPIERAFTSIRVDRNSSALIAIIALVPFAMLCRGMGIFLSHYCMTWVSTHVVRDLRTRLFRHVQGLSIDFHQNMRTGDLLSRITNDTYAIQLAVANGFSTVAREPLAIISLVSYLIIMQPRLTAVALVVFPLVVFPVVIFGRKVRRSWRAAQSHTAELNDLMHESFAGARVVKAYNLENILSERFAATADRITRQMMRFTRASELPGPVIELFGAIGVAALLYYVARLPSGQNPSAGDFTSFVGALFSLYQPVKSLSRLWSVLEQGRAAGERLFSILEIQSSIPEPAHPLPLKAAQAPVQFDRVQFGYSDQLVLHDFTLTIPPGQLVALVGSSGSGKTTVTNLLLRFHDPQQGNIRIGDLDLREVTTENLRRNIAIVTQETILFNDTIRANIRLGRPDATDAEVEVAARHAYAHDFIMAKPDGYDTMIGERGAALSGGQRQRLAIARAILKDSPILILDEATSSLDTESERAVQAALEELMQGRTTLCIAHRLSTVQKADRIVVLDQGRIVEMGKHGELLARNGLYQKLHQLQFVDG
jgi:subfamily B ATP-binding cassette protein MsbA